MRLNRVSKECEIPISEFRVLYMSRLSKALNNRRGESSFALARDTNADLLL